MSGGAAIVWIGIIFVLFTVLAGVADLAEKSADRRRRHKARAEARANRRKETATSDSSEFSWQ